MANKSTIPKEAVYEVLKETDKAALVIYEEVYNGTESTTYVFFVPKSILENADSRGKKAFFYRKTLELKEKVPRIEVIEEREKAVKVRIDDYSETSFWIPKSVFRANYDEMAWGWIKENKLHEFDYGEIIEYENAIYSKVHALFVPSKWVMEISGRYYVELGKLDWLKTKKKK